MKNIAFVCMGNTCRSPMAECVLKHFCFEQKDTDFKVASYGLSAENGQNINPLAKQVLKKHKIRYCSHKARKLTDKMLKKQDYVFVMTADIKRILKKYDNVYLISEFIDGIDIPDPFGLGEVEYEAVFQLLYLSVAKIYKKLKQLER